jgi:NAD-dependent deacetylase
MKPVVERLSTAILDSNRTIVLTGAGISTESGIPDYRGTNGQFWGEYDGRDFYISNFVRDSRTRRRCWQTLAKFYNAIKHAHPNPAHLALAKLERMKLLRGIITQNVDGLHQKAGNSDKIIIEIHGTAHSISCLDCGRKYDPGTLFASIANGTGIPYCEYCQGILKPDTVFPGEEIAPNIARKALRMIDSSQLVIVVGSSLEIQPAAYLPVKAKEEGAKLAIVSLGSTPYDRYADYLIHASASHVLNEVVKRIEPCAAPMALSA